MIAYEHAVYSELQLKSMVKYGSNFFQHQFNNWFNYWNKDLSGDFMHFHHTYLYGAGFSAGAVLPGSRWSGALAFFETSLLLMK